MLKKYVVFVNVEMLLINDINKSEKYFGWGFGNLFSYV